MSHDSSVTAAKKIAACDAFEARMNEWIDTGAELPIDDDRHLVDCHHCRQTLAIWRQLEAGMRTPAGVDKTSRAKASFVRIAASFSVAVAACVIAMIFLRVPTDELSVADANSPVKLSGGEVQLEEVVSSPKQVGATGESAKQTVPIPSDSIRVPMVAESSKPVPDVSDGLVTEDADQATGQNMLLAQFIAQSRPTVAQLGVGVAPLGRTLQRTAYLFY
ncbi:MAG: hypothetical protein CMM00_01750 [Rhodopirellula sp.]|jgi:hypothetical protein|uniref:hypothetical protein n=1 Tax=Rhodopirellula TaxID=265488 RepID=UPI000C5A4EDA|nr:hypothetical protein [Rhodopirellula sp. UBA1907]MAP07587.1 hypothetical protein [Rhodopirellula sp.]